MTRHAKGLGFGVLLAAAAIGCGDVPDEALEEEALTEADLRVTYNGDLTLLGSYHELFDKGLDTPCVRYSDNVNRARVGEPVRNLAIELVRSKEELAKKLGVDLNVKARYASIGGNAATNLIDEYTSATNSVTFLVSAQADYVVRDAAFGGVGLMLTDQGVEALEGGAAEFARECGTHYLSAVRHGARFYLLLTYKASSHASKVEMDASLGIDGYGVASGDVKTRLEKTAKLGGVQVTVHAASSGFWLDGAPSADVVAALESAQVDQTLFKAATALYEAMTKSVNKEYCLDGGEKACTGVPAEGYFARTRRDATVTGIQVAAYHSLPNATWTGAVNPFQVIKDRTAAHGRFLRAYSELQVRMENIYADEVRPFLEAAPQQKALYNVAPPGTPRRTPSEVWDVAKELEELIYPPTGGVMGWMRQEVHDRIEDCLGKTNVDITASCTKGDQFHSKNGAKKPTGELEAEQTVEWNQLYGFFDDYHKNRRILPIQVGIAYEATFPKAATACDWLANKVNKKLSAQGGSGNVVYRLAQGAEIKSLFPVISHGPVSWSSSDVVNATWFNPGPSYGVNCSPDYPYVQNQASGSFAKLGCSTDDWWDEELMVLCVPADGPMPLNAPQ